MSHLIWLAWIYQLTVKLITEIKTIWVRVAPTKQKVKETCSQVCALNVMYTFLSPISTQSPLLQVNWSSEQVVKDIIVFPKSPKQKKSLWISHSWGPEFMTLYVCTHYVQFAKISTHPWAGSGKWMHLWHTPLGCWSLAWSTASPLGHRWPWCVSFPWTWHSLSRHS